MKRASSRALLLLSIAASGAVLMILVSRFNPRMVIESIRLINGWWIGAALLISLLALLVRTMRWRVFLNVSAQRWSLRQLFPITLAGVSLSLLVPGSVGEIARAYYGGQRFGHRMAMLSSSIMDKWIGLVGVVLLGFWASLSLREYRLAFTAGLLLVGLVLCGLALRWAPRAWLEYLERRVLKRQGVLVVFQAQCRFPASVLAASLGLSVLSWLLTYFQLFLLFSGMSSMLSLGHIYTAAPLLTLASLMPLTWAGIGSREMVAVGLFQGMGVSPPVTIAACLLFNLTAIIIPALVGLFAIARMQTVAAAASCSETVVNVMNG